MQQSEYVRQEERCWANSIAGEKFTMEHNPQCPKRRETDIGLCLEHYLYLSEQGQTL